MTDATMLLEADGRAVDASPAALALLGVSLEELRSMPPGAFSPDAPDEARDAAFRAAWEDQGSPDLFGESTIVRPDGSRARVRFAIRSDAGGRFVVALESASAAVHEGPRVYTAGEILAGWREAERRLVELEPGSSERASVEADIEAFRTRYQGLFQTR